MKTLETWEKKKIEEWTGFEREHEIYMHLQQRKVGENFLIPLNREGIPNGLSDLGRDGSRGGVKIHPAFRQELHPEYCVKKVCNDPKNKRKVTDLKITKLLESKP